MLHTEHLPSSQQHNDAPPAAAAGQGSCSQAEPQPQTSWWPSLPLLPSLPALPPLPSLPAMPARPGAYELGLLAAAAAGAVAGGVVAGPIAGPSLGLFIGSKAAAACVAGGASITGGAYHLYQHHHAASSHAASASGPQPSGEGNGHSTCGLSTTSTAHAAATGMTKHSGAMTQGSSTAQCSGEQQCARSSAAADDDTGHARPGVFGGLMQLVTLPSFAQLPSMPWHASKGRTDTAAAEEPLLPVASRQQPQ